MLREGGWAEIISTDGRQVVARGHLQLDDLDVMSGGWRGRLDTIHPHPDAPALESGAYLLRLERYEDQVLVRVEVAGGAVRVHGDEHVLPATFVQRTSGA